MRGASPRRYPTWPLDPDEIHCVFRKDFGRGPCCVDTWSGGVGSAERLPLFGKLPRRRDWMKAGAVGLMLIEEIAQVLLCFISEMERVSCVLETTQPDYSLIKRFLT